MPKKTTGSASKKKAGATKKKATKKATKAAPKAAAKPAAKPAAKAAAKPAPKAKKAGRLRVRQVKSGIGHAETYRRTLRALGLKHHQDEVVVTDNPSIRGMVRKVKHLVAATPEEA
jgi:large subunit ribosomal protein L30